MTISAEELAAIFFNAWYCKNGLPLDIVSDHDLLFTSKFWTALTRLMGVCLKMLLAYHSQTNGASERTNKTLNQCIRYHVDHNQHEWQCALHRIHFQMMNMINASTGFFPPSSFAWAVRPTLSHPLSKMSSWSLRTHAQEK